MNDLDLIERDRLPALVDLDERRDGHRHVVWSQATAIER